MQNDWQKQSRYLQITVKYLSTFRVDGEVTSSRLRGWHELATKLTNGDKKKSEEEERRRKKKAFAGLPSGENYRRENDGFFK